MTAPLARLTTALADRYRIERELGAGGMASVYLAHDLKHDRDVAIKVLHPDLGAALGADRFLSEIKTTAKLQHPHILPLLDSGEADGLLYYVMPVVTGETLRARLERERQLPMPDAVRIAREVAGALDYAHRQGVVHRDIKPENILLHDGSALVADFGIALAVQTAGGSRMTQTGLSLGTPQYMSPEQAMGEKSIDARSDVYALGAVTYEMLAGDPPFVGSSVQAIVARVLTEKPTSLTTLRDTVPSWVDAAVLTALAKLPADRPATAAAFATALGDESAARPRVDGMRLGTAQRASASRRAVMWIGAATLTAFAAWGWLRPERIGGVAGSVGLSMVLPDSLSLDPYSNNPEGMPTLAISPDASTIVFAARHGARTQLYLRHRSDFALRVLDGTEGALAPFFSPDGGTVIFFTFTEVKRLAIADGKVHTFASIPFVTGGAWLADGRLLLSSRRGSHLTLVGSGGDSLRTLRCSQCAFPVALPDGRRAIASSQLGLDVIDLETGTSTKLLRWDATNADEAVRGTMARLDGDGHLVYVGPGGQVYAVPFDVRAAKMTGKPVIVSEGVRVESGRGAAQFDLATSGTIAWATGSPPGEGWLVRADRGGTLDTLAVPSADYRSIEMTPDGQRLVVSVKMPSGDMTLRVIDVATGRVTPWITAPLIVGARWMPDGRRVIFSREDGTFIGDPESTAPPQRLSLPAGVSSVTALADGSSFIAWLGSRMVRLRTDGTKPETVVDQSVLFATSVDDRWLLSEELGPAESSIIARSIDGRGRRFVISGGSRFSQVGRAGVREFIVVDVGNDLTTAVRDRDANDDKRGRVIQTFFSVSYDPTNADRPFGEPRKLFSASVSDFPGRNYAVGMNGNRFVFKQRLLERPLREVRLLDNWHARLTAGAAR